MTVSAAERQGGGGPTSEAYFVLRFEFQKSDFAPPFHLDKWGNGSDIQIAE